MLLCGELEGQYVSCHVLSAVLGHKVEGRRKSFLGVFGLTPRKSSSTVSGA